MADLRFTKNAVAINISRETALDYGLVEPTPKERAEREAATAEWQRKGREAWWVYASTAQALDNLTDPAVRAVLDLHAPVEDTGSLRCSHCYYDTEMGDRADYPCETVEAIAQACGIELPSASLYLRHRA